MRIWPTAVAVSLLVVLLTWLSFRALNTEAELFDLALAALDRFTRMESSLQRDVLSARVGALRNYDPLVAETNDLDATVLQLRATAAVDAVTAATVDRLASSIASQDELVEQFKSRNALLQNSLAYFGMYSRRLGAPDRAGPIGPAVVGLAAAMLRLTLDTSPAAIDEVKSWLNDVAQQPPPPGDTSPVQALLAHARLLQELLPQTDGVLKALLAQSQYQDRDALREMLLTRQSDSRTTARHFRLLLYLASLLLVAILVHLGFRLRERARSLLRRAAFEHVLAGISTRLINAPPSAIAAHFQHALAELAERVDADRAYFMAGHRAEQRHLWSRAGIEFPADWPDAVQGLAGQFRRSAEGIVHIPRVERLPEGRERATLLAAGVRAWVCVTAPSEDTGVFVLGFDALRDGPIGQRREFGLLRMALDAVANAVRRSSLEQETARLEQRLQQSRRIEAIGALTSSVAHNFNNIIAAILGYAEIAEAQVVPGSRSAQYLGEIRRAGERARDLIDQILVFGRRRDSNRQPVCLRDLIAEAVSLLRVSLPASIELAVDDTAESCTLLGERGQLQQVILNLCNNAAQAMDGSGRVEIATTIHEVVRTLPLSHGDLSPGRYVCIAVSDSGRGIDAAILRRIFEPFFTTRSAGNGLGLATVQEIVREHHGLMNVRSVPDAGSRFEAWLPCTAAEAPASVQELSALTLGNGEVVLLVEEDREQLLRAEEILAALGYEPVGFAHADEALTKCREALACFDALLVGHLASRLSALEFCAALHGFAPKLPILLAAAGAKDIGADALAAAHVSDVVHRPIIATEMAAALAGCLMMQRQADDPTGGSGGPGGKR
ncbi:MAG TPA: two-component system VirA-like sensor kinase [Rhodopila sp.]